MKRHDTKDDMEAIANMVMRLVDLDEFEHNNILVQVDSPYHKVTESDIRAARARVVMTNRRERIRVRIMSLHDEDLPVRWLFEEETPPAKRIIGQFGTGEDSMIRKALVYRE